MRFARSTSSSSRSADPLRAAALLLLATAGLSACASAPQRAPSGPRALSPDSAALLQAALPLVRPAYATQEQALRAGAYQQPAPALAASAPPAALPPRPAPTPAPERPAPAPARSPGADTQRPEPGRVEPVRSEPPLVEQAPSASSSPPAELPRAEWVIQLAAYRDRRTADAAAEMAAQRFPEWTVALETAGELVRVTLRGWSPSVGGEAVLRAVQESYPDAWLRRAIP